MCIEIQLHRKLRILITSRVRPVADIRRIGVESRLGLSGTIVKIDRLRRFFRAHLWYRFDHVLHGRFGAFGLHFVDNTRIEQRYWPGFSSTTRKFGAERL